MIQDWYKANIQDVLEFWNSSENGLSTEEARQRLQKYGFNKLSDSKTDSFFRIFLSQFQSALIYILLLVGLLIFIMGEIVDSLIIFFVLLFNALIGSLQEGRAQNTLLALKKLQIHML